jgi:hypothetical protein
MRKITLLMVLMIAFATAQAQLPPNWTDDTGIEIFKESSIVHGGAYSCGVIVNTDVQANCDFANTSPMPVTPGATYKISFWAKTSEHVRITAVVDWDAASTQYSNTYVGPATSGWEQFTFEGAVPEGVATGTARLRFYDVSGFNPGEINYVDDVAFESPVGTPKTVVNGDFENWGGGIVAEPSNYPTEFTATASGVSITLAWVDAVGDPLPANYLIKASTQNNITPPVDGTFVPNDLNLADGSGAANVAYGEGSFTFQELEPLTTYYFKIFPYTNSGTDVDYKTDGTAPSAQATTGEVTISFFTDFNDGWGGWTPVSVIGEQTWVRTTQYGIENSPCAKMSGFTTVAVVNEDWLLSPAYDIAGMGNMMVTFYSATKFAGPALRFKVSTNYNGTGNPNDATWDDLTDLAEWSTDNYEWTESGDIDMAAYSGSTVHLAFVYFSTAEQASTWEIDNIHLQVSSSITNPDSYLLGLYPNPSKGLINYDLKEAPVSIEVFNVTGQRLFVTATSGATGTIDLQQIPAGIFIIKFVLDEQGTSVVRRIIIE